MKKSVTVSLRVAPVSLRDALISVFALTDNGRATRLYMCATRLYTAPDYDPTGRPVGYWRDALPLQSVAHLFMPPTAFKTFPTRKQISAS